MGLIPLTFMALLFVLIAIYIVFKTIVFAGLLMGAILLGAGICFLYTAGAATFATTLLIFHFVGEKYVALCIAGGLFVGATTFYLLLTGTYNKLDKKFNNRK